MINNWQSLRPYTSADGFVVPGIPHDEHEHMAEMKLSTVLNTTPRVAEVEKQKKVTDPAQARAKDLLEKVQRDMEGSKKKNVEPYSRYLARLARKEDKGVQVPLHLYSPEPLEYVLLTSPEEYCRVGLGIPVGLLLIPIDGGTQQESWRRAVEQLGLDPKDVTVKVVIHHGKSIEEAQQAFHDMNLLRVAPSTSVAIAMDTRDWVTVTAHELRARLPLAIEVKGRQVKQAGPEVATLSGLRQGVLTSVFGLAGLQFGTSLINDKLPDQDLAKLRKDIVDAWVEVFTAFRRDFEAKTKTLIGAPSTLAGIGSMIHDVVKKDPTLTLDQAISMLSTVQWDKQFLGSWIWDGVGGKVMIRVTKDGDEYEAFSVGGPKEITYSIAAALKNPSSASGQQIRPVVTTKNRDAA
jgi:hypothetical protein